MNNTDVLVIGSDPAWLTAATLLVERSCHPMRRGPKADSWVIYRVTTPIWTVLRAVKLFYNLISLTNLKRSRGALRRRVTYIKRVEPAQMTAC